MDNMAYLQQISSTPPTKKSPMKSLLDGPIFKILVGVGVLAIILIIVFIITSAPRATSERTLVEQIQLRSANLVKTIRKYNKSLRTPSLRSTGQTFSTVLTETNRNISEALKTDYVVAEDDKEVQSTASKELKASEQAYIDKVNETLENARLNARLDRVFAQQMALETAVISSLESSLLSQTTNEDIKPILSSSLNNLHTLHETFDNFSTSTP